MHFGNLLVNEDKDRVVTGHIYILLFPSGKRYVGQTIQTVEKRMMGHWHPPKRERRLPVHNTIRKYGKDNVTIEKVFTLKCTQEYLDLLEQRAIKHYNTLSPQGYNLTEGGFGGAKSEKTKAKMRERRHSEETKAKISKNNARHWKGKHHSEATKVKLSVVRMGKHHSEESKAKMSAAKIGQKNPMKGRYPSEKTKARMAIAHKGKHFSEEHKAKISAAMKGAWQRRSREPNAVQ